MQFLFLSSESDADEKECTITSLFLRKGREGKRLEIVKGGEHGKGGGQGKGSERKRRSMRNYKRKEGEKGGGERKRRSMRNYKRKEGEKGGGERRGRKETEEYEEL